MRRTTHFYLLVSSILILHKGVLSDSIVKCDRIWQSNDTNQLEIKQNIAYKESYSDEAHKSFGHTDDQLEDVAMDLEVRQLANAVLQKEHLSRREATVPQRRDKTRRTRYQPYRKDMRREEVRDSPKTAIVEVARRERTAVRQRDSRSNLRRADNHGARNSRLNLQSQLPAQERQFHGAMRESEKRYRYGTDIHSRDGNKIYTSYNNRHPDERLIRRLVKLQNKDGNSERLDIVKIQRLNFVRSKTQTGRGRSENSMVRRSPDGRRDVASLRTSEDNRRVGEKRLINQRRMALLTKHNERYGNDANSRRTTRCFSNLDNHRRMETTYNRIRSSDEASRPSNDLVGHQRFKNLKTKEINSIEGFVGKGRRFDSRTKYTYRVRLPETIRYRVKAVDENIDTRRTHDPSGTSRHRVILARRIVETRQIIRRGSRGMQRDLEDARYNTRYMDMNSRRIANRALSLGILKQFGTFSEKTESFMYAGPLVHAITLGFAVFLGRGMWHKQI